MRDKKKFGILGIRIDYLDKKELENKLVSFLESNKYNWIATINAEILVQAHQNQKYAYCLNQSDLNLLDGSGPQYMSWFSFGGTNKIYRHPGVDLIDDILQIANAKKLKVLLFGSQELAGEQTVAEKAAKIFQQQYPNINITTEQGGKVSLEDNQIRVEQAVVEKLKQINPDIILVALSNPVQEKFVEYLKNILPNTKLGIGIGGSFNMITGLLPRAPKIFRILGLEWLWRLLLEPKRIKRILNAVIVFPSLVIWRVFFKRYRPNVSIAVMNQAGEFLLCQRKNEPEHWQFPQGGIEPNMNALDTLYKELNEEVGIEKNQITKIYQCPQKHKYLWEKYYLNKVFLNSFSGQKQTVFIVKFVGDKNDIKIDNQEFIDYQWVSKDEVASKLFHYRLGIWKIVMKNLQNIK